MKTSTIATKVKKISFDYRNIYAKFIPGIFACRFNMAHEPGNQEERI